MKIRGHREIIPSEIIFMRAIVNYTEIHLADGVTLTISKTLKSLEKQFDKSTFFRTHKSFIINTNYIESYLREDMTIRLSNSSEAILSRRRKEAFHCFMREKRRASQHFLIHSENKSVS